MSIIPWTKHIGDGLSHCLSPLIQFVQNVSSMLWQLDSRWQTWESGKKLNQVQLAFCWQMSRHWNSSLEETMSTSWLLVHSPGTKHWRSLQFPGFGSWVKRNKVVKIKNFISKLIWWKVTLRLMQSECECFWRESKLLSYLGSISIKCFLCKNGGS